jgi:hypothetical protein
MTAPDFTWDTGHRAFRLPEALEFLKEHTAQPEHSRLVYKAEFFSGGSYTDYTGAELAGPHMRVYRYAANADGKRFLCWHGYDGAEGHHAAEAKPLNFRLDRLPYEIGG